ncbi:LacI family DNA-binding transcriptional regulator [Pannonibacter phragmitetus]|uniref:LacI family DNA-binding transcriptional regulator n=1 Tax=Pannonibacter phragmitetus TaxID=121719 RepID=UPI003D2EFB71
MSNALSGKGRVSTELAERIRAKAAELGYMPSQAGRALRTGRSQVLGLVLPDIANPLFPQIAQAIEHAAAAAGYGVLIADSRGDAAMQTQAISRLQDRGVDGIVIVPRRGTRIISTGSPVAVIDSPSTPGNTVSADHWQGGALAGAHLSALGHRDVVIIGTNPASNVQNDRMGGIRAALGKACRVEVLWIEPHEALHGTGASLGLAARVAEGFTAFAALSDLQALRALTELQQAGLRVPQDASLTGFDDLIWSSAITPAITSVRMDMPAIAEEAIQALLRLIESQDTGTAPRDPGIARASRPSVPMSLVVRQTCGPSPAYMQNNDRHQQETANDR